MPDPRGSWTIAEVLLDLAQRPDLLFELEDAEGREAKQEILRREYGGRISSGRSALMEGNLKQIRVEVEAHFEFSDPKTVVKVTFMVVTF